MNAAEQQQFAEVIRRAIAESGWRVTRGVRTGGNLSGHEDLPAEALVAAWAQRGWYITAPIEGQKVDVLPFRLEQ